jgi:nucleolar protein 56
MKAAMRVRAWFGSIEIESPSPERMERPEEAAGEMKAASCHQEQPDLRALAKRYGFVEDDREYNARLRDAAIALVKRKLEDLNTAEMDLLGAVEALDDMDRGINLLEERLYEWSRLHLREKLHGRDLATALAGHERLGDLAGAVLHLMESRQRLEKEVEAAATCLAPNLASQAGPVLAARLICRAGGLERLAEMPSSALQLLGAEKALFKHLCGHASSPKHGMIYRHPAVYGAPRRLKGRMARALAGKLAIAARVDYFRGEEAPELKASLERRLREIKGRPPRV